MNLISTVEQRYVQTPDGAHWTKLGKAYSFWNRLLPVFDHVQVLARVREASEVPDDWHRADGDGVSFTPLPYYSGAVEYVRRSGEIRQIAERTIGKDDAIIAYAGSPISANIINVLRCEGHPYGVIVGGDPYDVFAPGATRQSLRPLVRWWLTREQQRQCRDASAALYVTDYALQRRYPCREFMSAATDVELPEEALALGPRAPLSQPGRASLVTVGTLEQLYKGPDVLIDAVATCVREGMDLKLTLMGDGKYRPELEARATSLGIKDRVVFLGHVSAGKAVRSELGNADIFLLPSHCEGLPRAMIEAMARALPCIGSTVGGIPELLPSEDMVPPGNVTALAEKIREVATDPARMTAMSVRNLKKAGDYREDVLRERRLEFYRYVKDKTEEWMRGN